MKRENKIKSSVNDLDIRTLGIELRGNLVLDDTRELDRELFYRIVYFIYQRPIVL